MVVIELLLPGDKDELDELVCSVICVLGRLELVYEECLDGDDTVEAGDVGRNIAAIKGSDNNQKSF